MQGWSIFIKYKKKNNNHELHYTKQNYLKKNATTGMIIILQIITGIIFPAKSDKKHVYPLQVTIRRISSPICFFL